MSKQKKITANWTEGGNIQKSDEHFLRATYFKRGVTPHWKRQYDAPGCYVLMEFAAHRRAKHVNLTLREAYDKGGKEAWVTLDEEDARALRDLLNEVLDSKTPEPDAVS